MVWESLGRTQILGFSSEFHYQPQMIRRHILNFPSLQYQKKNTYLLVICFKKCKERWIWELDTVTITVQFHILGMFPSSEVGLSFLRKSHITHRKCRHRYGLDYVNLDLVHRIPFIINLLKNACTFICWKDIQIIYQLYLWVTSKGVRIDKKWVWMFQEVERNSVFWRRGVFSFWDSMSLDPWVSQVSSYFLQNIV